MCRSGKDWHIYFTGCREAVTDRNYLFKLALLHGTIFGLHEADQKQKS